MDTFFADVTTARAAYNARQTENPLIAWICSPEWAPKLQGDGKKVRFRLPQMFRGMPGMNGSVWQSSGTTLHVRSGSYVVTGEINASTCHCHTGSGKAW